MRTYRLMDTSRYHEVAEAHGEPFRVIGPFPKLLTPWGVTVVSLGEDLTVAERGCWQEIVTGWLFAVVQYRPRHMPIQLGEFFIQDLMADNCWFEVKRNHEQPAEQP